jgi:hypothetical protein
VNPPSIAPTGLLTLALLALGLTASAAPAAAAGSTAVTAGGVSATVTVSDATFDFDQCVNVPGTMATSGPGSLALQATTPGSAAVVTGSATATAAGTTGFAMQVCPEGSGPGVYTVAGTFTAGGASAPLPAGLTFTVLSAATSYRSLSATVKGSKTTVAGQVVAVTTEGAIGATGSLRLSVRVPRSAGGTGRWTVLGTVPLKPNYGTFTATYPVAKVPKGSVVRAAFTADPWCTSITQTTPVT